MKRLAVALAILLVAAPSAEAAKFRLVGQGHVWTDGDRYAAVMLDGRPIRVIDDLRRKSWRVLPPRPGCFVGGIAAARVLWSCPEQPLLQELETGLVHPLPGWDANVEGRFAGGLGNHWYVVSYSCARCDGSTSYVNWRTGAVVPRVEERATRVVDVDAPGLEVPLCSPLRRRSIPAELREGGSAFYGSAYRRPWLLSDELGITHVIRLSHCREAKPVLRMRCECPDVPLGPRYMLWLDGYTVRGYDLRKRRTVRLGRIHRVAGPHLFATRRTVYVTDFGGYLWALPLPGQR